MNVSVLNCKKVLVPLVCLSFAALLQAAQLVTAPDPTRHPAAGGNGDSSIPLISPDGRFVLFASSADNLVASNARPALFPPRLNTFLYDRSNAVTTLVSVNLAGTGGGNGDTIPASVSPNGRYALIETSATDLFGGDTNSGSDVLVRDLVLSTNILVSIATNGIAGNGTSRSAVMTPDGRFVAFVSAANNLLLDDTNGIPDVFVRDLQAGTTTLVSSGATTTNRSSEAPELTPDGRYVAFFSTATNLLPGVPSGGDVYVRDLVTGTTVWASSFARTALQSFQNSTNAVSFNHAISADGKFVAYEVSTASSPTNGIVLRYSLDTGVTDIVNTNAAVLPGGAPEDIRSLAMTPDARFIAYVANTNTAAGLVSAVFVWDGLSGTNTLASGDLSGAVGTNSICAWPALTPEGRFVAFNSTAANLVTNSLAGGFHLYLRDLQAGVTTLVDAGTNGVGSGVSPMTLPRLSDNGRTVAFEAYDGNLVPNDSNKSSDVFARDLTTSATELISKHDPAQPSATASGSSTLSLMSVSADGLFVAFASDADNLVANDTNGFRNVFVRDLLLGTNVLVSVDASGAAPGNGVSAEPSISADGRYVAFTSTATNLVAGDTNRVSDVFVRDLLMSTTVLASVNLNGFSGSRASSAPIISSDGHAVLFHSMASDLAVGSFGSGVDNVFWRDLSGKITYPVSTNMLPPPNLPFPAAMTPDGRYVALGGSFGSSVVWDSQSQTAIYSNSVPSTPTSLTISPDGNRIAYVAGSSRIYVVDRAAAGTNVQITTGRSRSPRFSADGRFLAYQTVSAMAASDTNGLDDIYVYDFQTSSNRLVSWALNSSASGTSDSPDISADGRFVAYRSAAANLVPGDTNGLPDVFLWDRITGSTTLLSVSASRNASAGNRSLAPVFSGDGTTVVFESWASDIATLDSNRSSDLFSVSLFSSGQIPVFRIAIASGAGPSSDVLISWPVVPGRFYGVQFKNSLADPDWQDASGSVTIVGSQGSLNDLAPAGGQRFYRVVAE